MLDTESTTIDWVCCGGDGDGINDIENKHDVSRAVDKWKRSLHSSPWLIAADFAPMSDLRILNAKKGFHEKSD